mmetsp:Transcript_129025/g.413354  ORF Transcript_129025/g.413354 Transcript_129025/m.413354 type:complete len:302 (+) Transcript_129025:3845-4750(+)
MIQGIQANDLHLRRHQICGLHPNDVAHCTVHVDVLGIAEDVVLSIRRQSGDLDIYGVRPWQQCGRHAVAALEAVELILVLEVLDDLDLAEDEAEGRGQGVQQGDIAPDADVAALRAVHVIAEEDLIAHDVHGLEAGLVRETAAGVSNLHSDLLALRRHCGAGNGPNQAHGFDEDGPPHVDVKPWWEDGRLLALVAHVLRISLQAILTEVSVAHLAIVDLIHVAVEGRCCKDELQGPVPDEVCDCRADLEVHTLSPKRRIPHSAVQAGGHHDHVHRGQREGILVLDHHAVPNALANPEAHVA